MNKKNLRRVSMVITAQTLYHLNQLAAVCGYNEIGRVVDKLVREKAVSLSTGRKSLDTIDRSALLESIDGIYDCADMVFQPDDHPCKPEDCAGCKWYLTKQAIRRMIENAPAVPKGGI